MPNTSLNEGAAGGGAGASGDATADGAKIAVKPASGFGGATGVGAAGALGVAGTAEITSVFASSDIALSRIHDGRSVKVVRKRVTTAVVPSTS